MKNTKIFSKFLLPTLVVGLFGFVSVVNVFATDTPTSTTINNAAPAFTSQTVESWVQAYTGTATTDSRTESSSTYPTNQGTLVTFTATATDANNDQYYLIVCASSSTANETGVPTCESTYCTSSATNSGATASCNFDTSSSTNETYNWYSWVCDGTVCTGPSTTSNGEAQAEPTNAAGSPFHVNHIPTFTAADIAAVDPGDTLTFANSVDSDTDSDGTQDTFSLYVCAGEADQPAGGAVTAAFNAKTLTCLDGDDGSATATLCSDTGNGTGEQATCNDTQDIVSVPTAHAPDYTVKFYVVDSHGYATAVQSKDYAVNDVAPVLTSYNTSDTASGNITAGGSYDLTRAVTFTDNNGDRDPTYIDVAFFDTATAEGDAGDGTDACTADENDCYRFDNEDLSNASNCTVSGRSTDGTGKEASGSDNSLTVSCDFTIWFNANASTTWEMSATATDGTGDTNLADSTDGSDVDALSGISVENADSPAAATIAYGSISPGNSSTYGVTTQTIMQNMGNQIIDVLLDGTNMEIATYSGSDCANDTDCIATAQQKWDHTNADFDWNAAGNALVLNAQSLPGNCTDTSCTADDGCLNRDIVVRDDDHTTTATDEAIAWEILIPSAQESGSYTGTNTFSTATNTTCQGTVY